jgi:thiosulfate/3-mercaptopyruvate sulfurtransferase
VPFTTIVSPDALRERLGDPQLVVVDCRHSFDDPAFGRRLYDESHVPGAFFAGVEEDLAGAKTGANGRHPLPDPQDFVRFLRAFGADDETQIVAYDGGQDMFAARFWFLCRWIGHDATAVLDGGFAAWNARGYPVSSAPAARAREGRLTLALRRQLVVDADFVLAHLNGGEMDLVDARARERYSGETEPLDPVAGHIPGAKNRWFKENFDDAGRLKAPQRLREEFAQIGLDSQKTIHQCGSGVSAAVNYLAMEHAGLEGSRVYAGSWSEWVADRSRPVATGV